jgi:DNA-binding beta-propeller fold protein YncE
MTKSGHSVPCPADGPATLGEYAMNRSIALVSMALSCLSLSACDRSADIGPTTAAAAERMAPSFEVDPLWPKPLPNGWVIGSTVGVSVDSRDHVWIIHRVGSLNEQTEATAGVNAPAGQCCSAAPPVLEFDPEGNLVGSWGGPSDEYEWPESNHGITVDQMDNVWIGGNGESDSHLLKFTRSGQFLMQLGRQGQNNGSNDRENFGRVAEISLDPEANEAFIADGYLNKRVAVVDMDTGELKRYWGAYGNRPDDTDLGNYDPAAPPAQQFRNPVHCAQPSNDGLVYVCDRANDRIQVFRKDGTFVDELMVAPLTLGAGSVWDIALSRDDDQTWIFLADGLNERIYVIERATLDIVTAFGDGGRQPGQFFGVHNVAVDSQGNLYTTETYEGKRLQKFVYRGLAPVTSTDQGTLWPQAD